MNMKIYNLGNYAINNYILKTDHGVIVIDTGYEKMEQAFLKKLSAVTSISDIKFVFLTHSHDDHAGFLSSLLKTTNAKIVLHPASQASLEAGCNGNPSGAGYPSKLASIFGAFKKSMCFSPVDVGDRAVYVSKDKDQFFEEQGLPLKIIFLPGHTSGSIALFLEESKELFCGDAAAHVVGFSPFGVWVDNLHEFVQSWGKIIALNPSKIYPSHGSPFYPELLKKYRHTMDGKTLIPRK